MSVQTDKEGIFDKQVPRPAKSPAKTAQIQAQNRRREYLERNPSYLSSLDHELADPVLYERLIKRHQTLSERQQEGQAKGYGRVLEADLARGETRLSALATEAAGEQRTDFTHRHTWRAQSDVDNPWDGEAVTKEEGVELWREFLRERFIRGGDEEFDYAGVDGDEELDVVLRRDEEDRWFDEEEPSWGDGERKIGETGVQDF
ncbi:O-methyltransferase [Pochonia chlamydosporia 170]|uniref:O-methyltransferase n=1 Tax=Pochonia chlamydosporia 170 TaxID=1380566 RepID=A0A179F513_METCM|nr:O-methyltransferase [Pochonia chlamydosporia 170]OAQ60514.1 O-methyltransferase [Pochonia chlamydosporia 170]